MIFSNIKCPYCAAKNDLSFELNDYHQDGQALLFKCENCFKYFSSTLELEISLDAIRPAPCQNDGEHVWIYESIYKYCDNCGRIEQIKKKNMITGGWDEI